MSNSEIINSLSMLIANSLRSEREINNANKKLMSKFEYDQHIKNYNYACGRTNGLISALTEIKNNITNGSNDKQ